MTLEHLARAVGLLACKKPIDQLEKELCAVIGVTPRGLRHKALRLALELQLQRSLSNEEAVILYNYTERTLRPSRSGSWDL